MTGAARAFLAALACAVLASCATLPPPASRATFEVAPDASFALAGRLSARHGSDGIAANVRWTHAPGGDELLLATPLGAALARLDGTPARVRLELADGGSAEAPDWESLTTRVLGAPIPVRGLAWWVRASPRPGSAFTAEADAEGRLAVLRQDGWEIVYAYREGERRPMRLTLAYPGVEIRFVVDAWS